MKTKLFKTLAATAMSVLAIACAKEPVAGVAGDGETTEVSFNVEVPGETVVTKGISDASTTDELICQVFLNDGNYTPVPELTQKVAVDAATHKAKVEFSLVKGNKYAFIFWAQASGTDYYETSDLRSVKMNVNNVKANEPKMDAFWATATQTATSTPSKNNIIMYRALAQVNFGAVLPAQGRADAVTVTKSTISMKGVPDTFHPFLGGKSTACEGSVDITFAENATIDENLTVASVDYSYLATAYVFAPKSDKKLTDAKATFTMSTGKTTSISAPNVPIQGNYRTNILGDLLTVGATFNVKIDSEFKGVDKTYDAVSSSLEKGATVTLSNDYSVAKESTGVCIAVGVTSELNLNGKNFSNVNGATANKAALQVHGKLTINGDGEVYCEGGAVNNAIIVEQGGHLVINGGTYNVGKASSYKSNATIYVEGPDIYGRSGTVEIHGGTFKAEAGEDGTTSYVLNQKDAITTACFTVYGGTFIGFNPANVNEAHGAITSFVAPGYKSVKVSDTPETWEVVDATVTVGGQAELETALSAVTNGESAYVKLADGEYTLYGKNMAADKNLSIKFTGNGADNTSFKVGTDAPVTGYGTDYSLKGASATFKNMKVVSTNGDYKGFAHAKELYFEDCTLVGQFAYMGTKAIFKNCLFIQESANNYNLQTYTADEYVFDNCTFKAAGKFIYTYREKTTASYKVTFNNCHFVALPGVTETKKSAVSLKTDAYPSAGGAKYYVYFNETDATDAVLVGELTGSRLYSSDLGYNAETNTETRETQAVVYVGTKDGAKLVWENGAKVE